MRLEGRGAEGPSWILGLWIVACVAWLLVRHARTSEILFCLVGVVLLTYFGFRVRLGLPMFVIGLAAWAEAHLALAGASSARRACAAPHRAGALVALAALDFQPLLGWDGAGASLRAELARAPSPSAAPGARIGASAGTTRCSSIAVWSLRFAIDRAPTPRGALEGSSTGTRSTPS